MSFSLPLDNAQRERIVDAVVDAITYNIPELIHSEELPTSNGTGLFRWNYINRNLSRALDGELECGYAKRGPWRILLMHEQKSNATLSLMSKGTLERLLKHPPEHTHYMESLVLRNKFTPFARQLQLCGVREEKDVSVLERVREEVLACFPSDCSYHFIIVFDYTLDRVTGIGAVLLTSKMEVSYYEDWSNLLHKPLVVQPMGSAQENEVFKEEALVSLR